LKVGLLRPITLWPFPAGRITQLAEQVRGVLTVEMNAGQMVDDVRLAVEGRCPVAFYGRMGGVIPLADEILAEVEELAANVGEG
ncbi:MAG: 3-methyl-2-oxobutanoate dehydrogenase subunit beta, partial [Chloroflexota bacterium]